MALATASSPPTAPPASCCRFFASARRSPRCRRSSSRCASARRGWRTSGTPTTRACDASTASSTWPGLSIVSDHVEGTRLSDMLRVAHERNLQLDINAALCLIRQLVPAVALLHENAREVAHGLHRPRTARRDAARAPGDRRARDGGGCRAAAVQPRSPVAGVPDRDAAERRPVPLRSPRRRHRRGPRGARARARPAAPCRRIPQPSADAAERSARAHRARRRAAALAAAARLAGARAAARYAPRVRLGARSAVGARGDRRRRFDVRRGAGVARDVPVALHRVAPRGRSGSGTAGQRVRAGGVAHGDPRRAEQRPAAGDCPGGQSLGGVRGVAGAARSQ